MSSFDEFASNGQFRRGPDGSSSRSSFINNGDDAALTGLFHNAFGPVQHSSQDIPSEEEFPLDDFEASVMTSCLLSVADNVPVPASFEDEVMSRISAEKAPVGETPRSFRSPLLRHTSRELYLRYRRVVQVVFPLAAAASIVVAMYVRDKGINLGSIFTWPPFSTEQTVEPADNEVKMPEFNMQQVPVEQPSVSAPSGNQNQVQSVDKNKAVPKKKVKRQVKEPITGE